jgi:hypothetical protein
MGLIGLGIAGAVGVFGHIKSREYVRRKLRFTSFIEKPGIGFAAGAVTAIAVAALPVVGIPTGLIVGAGVGSPAHVGDRAPR